MNAIQTKASLSHARQRLLELMQNLNHGRLENLIVRAGEPVLTPLPRIVRDVKFGSENGPRPERDGADFTLKSQVVEFFQHLDRLGNTTIESVEVKHGLPFLMRVAELSA